LAPHRAADHRAQRRLTEFGHIGHRLDAVKVQFVCGLGPDAPQPAYRQRMQESEFTVGGHQQQAVGFGFLTGHLGEELGPGDADGDRQTDPVAYLSPQVRGDFHRCARHPSEPGDVEKRLVDRQWLDQRGGVPKDLENRPAGLRVRRHSGRHHDRLRAQRRGLTSAHRGAYPVRLGLVAGGKHDAAAHDHRAAAQRGVVTLLYRGVERIEVGVQDAGRRSRRHEHMFARRSDN
jgi:hypothetical protein